MTHAGTPALNRPPNKSEADRLRERIDAAVALAKSVTNAPMASLRGGPKFHYRQALLRIEAILDPGAKQGQEN